MADEVYQEKMAEQLGSASEKEQTKVRSAFRSLIIDMVIRHFPLSSKSMC